MGVAWLKCRVGWSNSHGHHRQQMPDARPKEIPAARLGRPTASRTIPPRRRWQQLPAKPIWGRVACFVGRFRRLLLNRLRCLGNPLFLGHFRQFRHGRTGRQPLGKLGRRVALVHLAAHRQQAAHLVFPPMLFARRPVLFAEMVAPLIATAVHRSHRDLRRIDGGRSDLLLRQIHLLEPLDGCVTLGHTLDCQLD